MILVIQDETGESVFDGVQRASVDRSTGRVTFIDPTAPEEERFKSITIGVLGAVVTVVDRGTVMARWSGPIDDPAEGADPPAVSN